VRTGKEGHGKKAGPIARKNNMQGPRGLAWKNEWIEQKRKLYANTCPA